MKSIGEKIKEIRKQNKLSQENLYPSNQSLVSQIEKGIIKNPNESTLRIFAENIGVSFDELVDGTDWDRNMTKVKKTAYAISQSDPTVTIEKSGKITAKLKSYPRYNDSGEENKYCPKDGTPLLIACPECGRSIESPDIRCCMGCGETLFPGWFPDKFVRSGFSDNYIVNNKEQRKWEQKRTGSETKSNILIGLSSFTPGPEETQAWVEECFLPWNSFNYPAKKMKKITHEEILKQDRSDVPDIRSWFINNIRHKNYCNGVLSELKRYAHLMFEDDENMEIPPENGKDENQNIKKEEDTNNG